MPSEAFLKTAKEGNRQPVVLMAVESLNAVRVASAGETGWRNAKASFQVDIDSEPGYVVPGAIPLTGTTGTQITAPYHLKVRQAEGTIRITNNQATAVSGCFWLELSVKGGAGTPVGASGIWLDYTVAPSSFITRDVLFLLKDEPFFASGAIVDVSAITSSDGQTAVTWEPDPLLTIRPSSSWIQTRTLDLGEIPTNSPVFGVKEVIPVGTAIIYTARGSNDAATWVDLGPVAPGNTLLAYRYYDIRADLSFSGWDVPKLREIHLLGGDKQYDYFSTHRDEPVTGAKPYLLENALSSLNSKIELLKPPSTGEVSVKMAWTRETGELLKSGYLKNKTVIVKVGFCGLAEADYEPVFAGTWYDYTADPSRMEISIKLRDVLKQFAKRKIPAETMDDQWNKVTTPLSWTDANVMQVMLDVFDYLEIPDRYLDRAEFENLGDPANISATFTRASVAYQEDGTQVAVDVPRYQSGGGVLVEEGTTNQVSDSRNLVAASWITGGTGLTATQDQVGFDGQPSAAWTLNDTSITSEASKYVSKAITNDSNTHAASVYLKKENDETFFPCVALTLNNGTTPVNAIYLINKNTGACSKRSDASASGVSCTVEDAGTFWQVTVTAANNGTGNTEARFYLVPASTTTWAGALEVSTTGASAFDQAQLELNKSYSTSPMITAGAAATRADEQATLPASVLASSAGTIEARVLVDAAVHSAAKSWMMAFSVTDDANEGNQIRLGKYTGSADWHIKITGSAGSNSWLPTFAISPGWRDFAITWDSVATTVKVFVDGVLVASNAAAPIPDSFAAAYGGAVHLGTWFSGDMHLNSPIGPLRISSRARTDAEIADAVGKPLVKDKYTTALLAFDGTLAATPGLRSGSEWNVTRTVSEPVEASKLLNELAVTAGIFLSPQPDGALKPIVYDPAAGAVAVLDARAMKFGRLDGGQKELFTRQHIYHSPNKAKPGDNESDYDKALIYINADAEINWGESSHKSWFDKWNASDQAVIELAKHMDDWFANPRMTVTVDDVPPRFATVMPGQIVTVDNLQLPDLADNWPGLSAGNKFLVLSRDYDPKKATLRFSLFDIGMVGTSGAGVVGTDMVISGPAKPFGATNVYTRAGGAPPYSWSTTAGVLTGIDSTSVNLDVTGVTGSGAISVTDAGGTVIFKYSVLPPQVENLTATIHPDWTRLAWQAADPATIAEYEIRQGTTWDTAGFVSRIRATEYQLGFLAPGDYTYFVAAVDVYGNFSGDPTKVIFSVSAPGAPVASGRFEGGNFRLTWAEVTGGYKVVGYEIRYGTAWAGATFVTTIKSRDYKDVADWSGTRNFWVAAVNAAGVTGTPAQVPLTVNPAPAPTVTPQVIDNNVLLRWSAVQGTLPVADYEVRRGADFGSAYVVGRKAGTFTAIFEDQPAAYTYWVVAVDTAGNYGTPAAVTATVNEPPDYLLEADWYSDFSGTKTNAKAYGGQLLAPINAAETFAQHFTTHLWNSPQDQINAGYPIYAQPTEASAQYQETFDYGSILPSTKVTVTPTVIATAGVVTVSTTIEVSADGIGWTTYAGQAQVYVSNFRYVRVTLDFTPQDDKSLVCLDDLNVKLDVKLKNDAGKGYANAADPTGTTVTFNKQFIDVASINVTSKGTTPVIPVYDFVDQPYPTEFKVYLFDNNGNRVSGDFAWTARGY